MGSWRLRDGAVQRAMCIRGTSDNTALGAELLGELWDPSTEREKKPLISQIPGRVFSQQQLYKQVLL